MESIKEFPRGIEAGLSVEVSKALCEISMTSNCLKSDQVISLRAHDGECERAPDQGLKLQAREDIIHEENERLLDRSSKPQAASVKHQADPDT